MSDYKVIEEQDTPEGTKLQVSYEGDFHSSVVDLVNDVAEVMGVDSEVYGSGRSRRAMIGGDRVRARQNSTDSEYPTRSYSIHLPDRMSLMDIRTEEEAEMANSGSGERHHTDADFEDVGQSNETEGWQDGMVHFTPPFTKNEVAYKDNPVGEGSEKPCESCAHYVEGGGCKLVRGRIEPEGTCGQYADFGLYGSAHGSSPNINLSVWGEDVMGRLSTNKVEKIIKQMRTKLENKMR